MIIGENYAGSLYQLKNKQFIITWVPDIFCNYSCSYCWPGYNSKFRNHLDIDVLTRGLSTLKSKVNDLGIYDFFISFVGGEPTVWPGFLELVQFYASDTTQKTQKMNITTNLSQGEKWWTNLKNKTENLSSLTINASWHRESVGDVEKQRYKFLRVRDILKSDNHTNFFITMVAPPSQFDDVYSDALFFRKNNAKVVIRAERKIIKGITVNHPDYSQDMLDDIVNWNNSSEISDSFIHVENGVKTLYDDVEQVIAFDKTDYRDWLCYAGSLGIHIKPNGDIMRGFGCIDAKIGNITNDDYIISSNPKMCITPKCACATDMKKPKIKI